MLMKSHTMGRNNKIETTTKSQTTQASPVIIHCMRTMRGRECSSEYKLYVAGDKT